MVGLAFAVAASANFPVLILSIMWERLTTKGAFIGGFLGLSSSILLVILSPTVWVDIFGFEKAIFPYKYPAIFSVTIAFLSIIFISLKDKEDSNKDNKNKFKKLVRLAYLGRK